MGVFVMRKQRIPKARKGRVMAMVLIFLAVVALLTTATVVTVSRYQKSLRLKVEELRLVVYDGE